MKKIVFTLFTVLFYGSSYATDLIVEEFGISPAYPSIADAITAGNDGDRIFIKNRTGNIPWIENLTLTKSVELLSFQTDTFFLLQGNVTIIPSAAGKTFTIIGMRNTSGGLSTSSSSPVGNRSTVNIMSCLFESGSITNNGSYFHFNIVANKLVSGYINVLHGNVTGNDITTNSSNISVSISTNADSKVTYDTVQVFGNKVNNTASSGQAIYINGYNSPFRICNNYVYHRYIGIYAVEARTSNPYINQIYNNTVVANGTSSTTYGIYIYNNYNGSIVEIMNNAIDATSSGTKYGIYLYGSLNGSQVNIYYNHIDVALMGSSISGIYTIETNNTINGSFTVDADGRIAAGGSPIDGANPSPVFYDLDLTIGDAGAYGGSYSLENYFPLFYGGARVYHVDFPRNVRQGTSLSIKADAFDR